MSDMREKLRLTVSRIHIIHWWGAQNRAVLRVDWDDNCRFHNQ